MLAEKIIDFPLNGSNNSAHSNSEKPNNLGNSSEVQPFRTKEEIQKVFDNINTKIKESEYSETKKYIWERNKLLVFLGMNIGLRGSDLCKLRWCDILNNDGSIVDKTKVRPQKTTKKTSTKRKIGNTIDITPSYTGKYVDIFLNSNVKTVIKEYLNKYPYDSIEDYIFLSRKGNNKPLCRKSLARIVKEVSTDIEGNFGSHSLRKTFGYQRYNNCDDKKRALVYLQKLFGHTSTDVTLRYIGILDEDLQEFTEDITIGYDVLDSTSFDER